MMKKINWRHILLHLLGIWLLQKASTHFAIVLHSELFEAVADPYGRGSAYSKLEIVRRQLEFLVFAGLSSRFAMLTGMVISLFITIRKKWYWLNAVIAMIVVWLILYLSNLNPLVWLFGAKNEMVDSVFALHLLYMLVYLGGSLLFFFLPALQRWVQKDYLPEEPDTAFQFEEQLPEAAPTDTR